MKKKFLIPIGILIFSIFSLSIAIVIYLNTIPKDNNINNPLSSNTGENDTTSYPISNPIDTSTPISYAPIDLTKLISYTHSSGKYGFDYPSEWEFLPERGEMGLRPKEFTCNEECFNEIITVLYFEGKGVDLKDFAMIYDGGTSEEWKPVSIGMKSGIYYNYSSSKLKNDIYWFSNGTDAVKIMFREFNVYNNVPGTDNSRFKNAFEIILNSFHFIE